MDPRPLLSRFFDVAFRSARPLRAEISWSGPARGLVYFGCGLVTATVADANKPDGPIFVLSGRLNEPDALYPGQFEPFTLEMSWRGGHTTASEPEFSCSVGGPDERLLEDPTITGSNSFHQVFDDGVIVTVNLSMPWWTPLIAQPPEFHSLLSMPWQTPLTAQPREFHPLRDH